MIVVVVGVKGEASAWAFSHKSRIHHPWKCSKLLWMWHSGTVWAVNTWNSSIRSQGEIQVSATKQTSRGSAGVFSIFGKNVTNFASFCATTMEFGIPNQSECKGLLSSIPDFQLCFLGKVPFFSCQPSGSPGLFGAFAFNAISQLRPLTGSSLLNIFAGLEQPLQSCQQGFHACHELWTFFKPKPSFSWCSSRPGRQKWMLFPLPDNAFLRSRT